MTCILVLPLDLCVGTVALARKTGQFPFLHLKFRKKMEMPKRKKGNAFLALVFALSLGRQGISIFALLL